MSAAGSGGGGGGAAGVGDGAGGGGSSSEAGSPSSAVSTAAAAAAAAATEAELRSLQLVLARWLDFHAPTAKRLLAACLRPLSSLGNGQARQVRADAAAGLLRVTVENAGSGVVVVRGLELMKEDSINTLIQKAVRRMVEASPTATVTDLRVFSAQGGMEFLNGFATVEECGIKDGGTVVAMVRVDAPKDSKQNARVRAVCFTPDSKHLVTGTWDSVARVYSIPSAMVIRQFEGHGRGINAVCVSPDGRRVVTASNDHTAKIWNFKTGECLHTLPHTNFVTSAAVAAEAGIVATGSWDNSVRVWGLSDGVLVREVPVAGTGVATVSLLLDASAVAVGLSKQGAPLMRLDGGGAVTFRFQGQRDWTMAVALSPDGRLAACGSDDRSVGICNAADGELVHRLEGHTGYVRCVAWSADSTLVVSGSDDMTGRVWRAADGECLRVLPGHAAWVRAVCFSPSGEYVVTGSDDHTSRVWALEDGRLVAWLNMMVFR